MMIGHVFLVVLLFVLRAISIVISPIFSLRGVTIVRIIFVCISDNWIFVVVVIVVVAVRSGISAADIVVAVANDVIIVTVGVVVGVVVTDGVVVGVVVFLDEENPVGLFAGTHCDDFSD